uniref:Uncharacterized protein n=1 Tax=Cryptomonas curvata TaxID=233186 RepID=A0A7S0MJ49_9CRYP|mmetsp:Transcript_4398/g.9778  ORF Transcript_4398/g.9778 Transcript_4398/m.9778 type:complete len:392 (+) Transcript_4398:166-1341(+)
MHFEISAYCDNVNFINKFGQVPGQAYGRSAVTGRGNYFDCCNCSAENRPSFNFNARACNQCKQRKQQVAPSSSLASPLVDSYGQTAPVPDVLPLATTSTIVASCGQSTSAPAVQPLTTTAQQDNCLAGAAPSFEGMNVAEGNANPRPPNSIRSISIAGLLSLLTCLSGVHWFKSRGLDKNRISSTHIRDYLFSGGTHPARLFPDCFSFTEPIAALTYEWRLTFGDILSFLNPIQIGECNDQHHCSIPAAMASLFVWIDVFFIDQLSTDIASNLLLAQSIYTDTPFHLALATSTVCTRAWVLFEFGVRRAAGKESILLKSLLAVGQGGGASARPDLSIDNFMAESDGKLFQKMESFKEEDKVLIRCKIIEAFTSPERFNKEIYTRFYATWNA